MTRHSFRWESLAFGLLFLAAVGGWAVWEQDALSPREFSLTVAGTLIVLGLLGVAVTLRQARPRTSPTPRHDAPETEGAPDEQAHPNA